MHWFPISVFSSSAPCRWWFCCLVTVLILPPCSVLRNISAESWSPHIQLGCSPSPVSDLVICSPFTRGNTKDSSSTFSRSEVGQDDSEMKPDDISSNFICIIYPEEDEAQYNVTIEIFPPADLMICTLMFLSVKYKGPMGYDRAWLANWNGSFHVNFHMTGHELRLSSFQKSGRIKKIKQNCRSQKGIIMIVVLSILIFIIAAVSAPNLMKLPKDNSRYCFIYAWWICRQLIPSSRLSGEWWCVGHHGPGDAGHKVSVAFKNSMVWMAQGDLWQRVNSTVDTQSSRILLRRRGCGCGWVAGHVPARLTRHLLLILLDVGCTTDE